MSYKVYRIIKQIGLLALLFTAASVEAAPIKKLRTNSSSLTVDAVTLTPHAPITLKFSYKLPPNSELNHGAPSDLMVHDGQNVLAAAPITQTDTTLSIPADSCSNGKIFIDTSIFYCGTVDRVCKIKSFTAEQACSMEAPGNSEINITADINRFL